MYYSWSWWWLMTWLIPMLLLVWFIFGWGGSRRGYYRGYARRDELWNDNERASRGDGNGLHRGRGPRNYIRSDARIQEDICERLSIDDLLDASDIEVEVDNGIVQLRGKVETRADKRRAESIADSVLGTRDVDNKLEIGRVNVAASPSTSAPVHQS